MIPLVCPTLTPFFISKDFSSKVIAALLHQYHPRRFNCIKQLLYKPEVNFHSNELFHRQQRLPVPNCYIIIMARWHRRFAFLTQKTIILVTLFLRWLQMPCYSMVVFH